MARITEDIATSKKILSIGIICSDMFVWSVRLSEQLTTKIKLYAKNINIVLGLDFFLVN